MAVAARLSALYLRAFRDAELKKTNAKLKQANKELLERLAELEALDPKRDEVAVAGGEGAESRLASTVGSGVGPSRSLDHFP